MAIFYKHIKGCGAGSTGAASSTTDLWTWINFSSTHSATNTVDYLPTISYKTDNTTTNDSVSLGKIITSGATGQSIDKPFTFTSNVDLTNGNLYLAEHFSIYSTLFSICEANSKFYFSNQDTDDDYVIYDYTSNQWTFKDYVDFQSNILIEKYLNIGDTDSHTNTGDLSAINIYATTMCQAQYFNATSDRRAKTNIRPANFVALDIIDHAQVKNFTYKSTNTPSIGLIAQDIINDDIDDFALVTNKTASGEDGDYMSIHESKLVYILWKAVQEQQEEIETLWFEIKRLRNKLK